MLQQFNYGPLFLPPSPPSDPTIYLPGWTGRQLDRRRGRPRDGGALRPLDQEPIAFTITETDPNRSAFRYIGSPALVEGPNGLPLFKPPYGRITAIDLNTGEHLWMTPHGTGPRSHPRLKDLDLPALGWPHRGAPLVTKTLLFVTQEGPWGNMRFSDDLHAAEFDITKVEPAIRAFDKKTGELLAEIPLPANSLAAPMTYMHGGKQFIGSVGGWCELSLGAGRPGTPLSVAGALATLAA